MAWLADIDCHVTTLGEDIVMLPAAFTMVTPEPALKFAATGCAPVDPIINWPFESGPVNEGTPVKSVVKTPELPDVRPVTVLLDEL